MDKKTNWIQTYKGKKVYPLEPDAETINIEDIAHALSQICRYTGHSKEFYSVAKHCIIGAKYFIGYNDYKNAMLFLLHDATEAYLCDVSRPVKQFLPDYKKYEDNLMKCILNKYNLGDELTQEVYDADFLMLFYESCELSFDNTDCKCFDNIDKLENKYEKFNDYFEHYYFNEYADYSMKLIEKEYISLFYKLFYELNKKEN